MKAKVSCMVAITTTIILFLASKHFAAAEENQEQKYKDYYPSLSNISNLISNTEFNNLLKHRNDVPCPAKGFYTYEAFITATLSFPAFANVGDNATRKREIAAFLAQTSHETTGGWACAPDGPYAWGYCSKKEQGSTPTYCVRNTKWPCFPGRKYYGRGPIQMTYNYNYGPAGKALGIDLLKNPDFVETNPTVSFLTSLWIWMTPQPRKPSCHNVITGLWKPTLADKAANRIPGYGVITNIINGNIECGHGPDYRAEDRIGFYKRYTFLLGVSPGRNLNCGNQKPFVTSFVSGVAIGM